MGGSMPGLVLMAALSCGSSSMLSLAQSQCSRVVLSGCDAHQLQACLAEAQAHSLYHKLEIGPDDFFKTVSSSQVCAPDATLSRSVSHAHQDHVAGGTCRQQQNNDTD